MPMVRHKLRVTLTPGQPVVETSRLGLREKIARRLLGPVQRYTLLVPGDSVDEVTIIEQPDEDLTAVAEAVGGLRDGDPR